MANQYDMAMQLPPSPESPDFRGPPVHPDLMSTDKATRRGFFQDLLDRASDAWEGFIGGGTAQAAVGGGSQPKGTQRGATGSWGDGLTGMLPAASRTPEAAGAANVPGGGGGPLNDRTSPQVRLGQAEDARGGVGGHTKTPSSPGTTNGRQPATLQGNSGQPPVTGMGGRVLTPPTAPDQATYNPTDPGDTDSLTKTLKGRLDALDKQSNGRLDLTPLLALSDSWSGGHLAQSYDRPLTEAQRESMKTQLAENLAKRQSDLEWHRDQIQARIDTANARSGSSDFATQMKGYLGELGAKLKQDKFNLTINNPGPTKADTASLRLANEDFKGLGKDLDSELASSRTGIGLANNKVNGATRLMTFADVTPDDLAAARKDPKAKAALISKLDNLTAPQYTEVVSGLMGQLNNGGVGSLGQLEALRQPTAEQTYSKAQSYFSSNPVPAGAGALIYNNLQTLRNEQATSQSVLDNHAAKMRTKHPQAFRHPDTKDDAEALLSQYQKPTPDSPSLGGTRGGETGPKKTYSPAELGAYVKQYGISESDAKDYFQKQGYKPE